MNKILDKVHPDWISFFEENKESLNDILSKIDYEKEVIYPKKKKIFKAFFYTSPKDIKLVLLGQDPYINSEVINDKKIPQACGLSFSVPKTHKIPPSLKNIYKEIKNCYLDYEIPNNGDLSRWIKEEKILLLNSALTVLEGKSNSHANLWGKFTDKIIEYISKENEKTMFLLMGSFAINKAILVDLKKHQVFSCVHPSPLSAHKGFFGCGIFKKINDYLISINLEPINW
jgi:uracil-DNA glycosylase